MNGDHVSIYESVTRSIIEELEKGAVPWVKPWRTRTGHSPRNAVSQRRYRGVNVLLLWSAAIENGYASPAWLSFRQARELGGTVRKGEHGSRIVYAASVQKLERSPDGKETARDVRFLKWYWVFNVAQTEGLPDHLYDRGSQRPLEESLAEVDAFIRQIGADVRHGGVDAYYNRERDFIMLPDPERFEGIARTTRQHCTSMHTGVGIRRDSVVIYPDASEHGPTPPKNSSPNSPPRFFAQYSKSQASYATRDTSRTGSSSSKTTRRQSSPPRARRRKLRTICSSSASTVIGFASSRTLRR